MRDVAALAGVGLKTVSRVVNGESNVSDETRARVEAAIDRLDYRRDINASLLRRLGRKTATIGLVLEDVSNPFSSASTARSRIGPASAESCCSPGAATKTPIASES